MSAAPKGLLSLNQKILLIGDTTKRRGAEKRSLVGDRESEYLLSDFRCLEYVHVYAMMECDSNGYRAMALYWCRYLVLRFK